MTIAIVPAPNTLELHSPELGPWFDQDGLTLPLPNTAAGSLDITLNLTAPVSWLPPAAGLLSFFVATDPRPEGLAILRGADGGPAFTDGNLVAVFRLLSWVERRLDSLTTLGIPSVATGAIGTTSGRPIVRYLAMELPGVTDVAGVRDLLPDDADTFPSWIDDDAERAATLGLSWEGGVLGNASSPMTDLRQPGDPAIGSGQELLKFETTPSTQPLLSAFDHRGRPLDAGAVASWWTAMAQTSFANLWAAGGGPGPTVAVSPGLTYHLTNAHEGPLDQAALARVTPTGTGVVRTASSTTGVTLAFSSAPDPDDLPQPLVAVLPDGLYANQVVAWGAGPLAVGSTTLTRDFIRIGVMSVEHDLVGQKRTSGEAADTVAARRANDQARNSTGVRPARSPRNALLSGTDAVLTALATPAGGANPTTVVTSVADRDAGPLTLTLPDVAAPTDGPSLVATALVGGGAAVADGNLATEQSVLLTGSFDSALAGAWVRFWPLGFDHDRGEHVRLTGGAAPIDGNGDAAAVVPLPDGTVDSANPPRLGVDVLVVTQDDSALFTDVRFERPSPTGSGQRVGLPATGGQFLVCSTAVQHTAALPAGSVPSGSEVVNMADPPELIDRATIPSSAFAASALTNLIGAGDVVQLTAPAFKTQDGDPFAAGESEVLLGETGATIQSQTRQAFDPTGLWTAGFPLPGMERLEVVASQPPDNSAGAAGAAVVGSAPLLGAFHELGTHQLGHPQCPAAPEVHGNGVVVSGPATVPFAEYVRDRTIGGIIDLVTAAVNATIEVPTTPTTNSLWIAGLRTEAAGVATELAWEALDLALDSYPFDDDWQSSIDWAAGVIGALPTAAGAAAVSALRALERRLITGAYGAREGATAMVAAIERAEDFIYIETPAFDNLTFGSASDDDEISLWQALIDRMDAVPSLHVAVCVPHRLMPGTPDPLQRARDAAMNEALSAISAGSSPAGSRATRFVAFSPAAGPARSLHLAGTTMVVDDLVAFVGTTHLWRRGLSFDSSYAAAVFDEQTIRGRSAEVAGFRTAILAAQLGTTVAQIPLDPPDTIRTISKLVELGGLGRLAAERIRPPDPTDTTTVDSDDTITEADVWIPDGTFDGWSDPPVGWLAGLSGLAYGNYINP